jgi:hypothetical protein
LISKRQQKEDVETDITIKRLGDGIMPVETEIVTQSGDTIRKMWDGAERETTMSFITSSKFRNFELDPDDVILDQNRLNNSKFHIKSFLYPDFPSM